MVRLTHIKLPDPLSPFIHSMWIFESGLGLPSGDARIVVPNGRTKLIVPWRNGLTARSGSGVSPHPEGDAVVIGLWDTPTEITSAPIPTVTIGVEFSTKGFCRFFDTPACEITQRIESIGNILGAEGDLWVGRVMSSETKKEAVDQVLQFLIRRFLIGRRNHDLLVDHAIEFLKSRNFRTGIEALEQRMGYSRRYLAAVFQRDIGFGPKRLQSILAFEQLYRAFSLHRSAIQLRRDALDVYYDQSHFIRHFKQFTGCAPGRFAEMENEFGRLFYHDVRLDRQPDSLLSNP